MITVITGIPGSGKTLFCVDKMLRSLLDKKYKHLQDDGSFTEIGHTIYSNINGLLIEHEKIEAGAPWTYNGKTDKWEQGEGLKTGLNNWHEWAKPGSVIVFDEIQKPWPLAATGSKVPPPIEALETHRHMGVDFIQMTQHPMMIHANLTRLAGRHLHMRRLGNMPFASVYEWDGVSRSLLYKNTMSKYPYRYGKKAFDLYKSAEVHTKQPRKMPSLLWGVLIAVAGMAYAGPMIASRLSDRLNPKPPEVMVKAAAKPLTVPVVTNLPAVVFSPPGATQPMIVVPEISGCITVKDRCSCFDSVGKLVPVMFDACRTGSSQAGFVLSADGVLTR